MSRNHRRYAAAATVLVALFASAGCGLISGVNDLSVGPAATTTLDSAARFEGGGTDGGGAADSAAPDSTPGDSTPGDSTPGDSTADSTLDTGRRDGSLDAGDSTLDVTVPPPDADATVGQDAPADVANDVRDADAGITCPTGPGPVMVLIPGSGFCIDSTEVTRDQYSTFLNTSPTNKSSFCGWNSSFVLSADWPPAAGEGTFPVDGIDWCDAYAYCAWAGKRMCGNIAGGSVAAGNFDDPTKSQWMAACTAKGTQTLPYGSTYIPAACNDAVYDAGGPIAVASRPKCQGGYPGIFDMLGNIDEWEDSCADAPDGGPAFDTCHLRGEAYGDTTASTTCAAPESHKRSDSTTGDPAGVRCCWP